MNRYVCLNELCSWEGNTLLSATLHRGDREDHYCAERSILPGYDRPDAPAREQEGVA